MVEKKYIVRIYNPEGNKIYESGPLGIEQVAWTHEMLKWREQMEELPPLKCTVEPIPGEN